ncbi:MAG: hypothetical protein A2096_16055 [Spirochaetes bacterium GWF1_41_5]|nr:MAG: hypothetical protein A2096_16055 [Spirochaetes bacterium GWF1_41_5]
MNIICKLHDQILIIYIQGDVNLYNIEQFRTNLLEAIAGNEDKKIIFNLSEMQYIDSSGIGVLIQMYTKINNKNTIRFCHVNQDLLAVFRVTRLDNFFIIDQDETASIAALSAS